MLPVDRQTRLACELRVVFCHNQAMLVCYCPKLKVVTQLSVHMSERRPQLCELRYHRNKQVTHLCSFQDFLLQFRAHLDILYPNYTSFFFLSVRDYDLFHKRCRQLHDLEGSLLVLVLNLFHILLAHPCGNSDNTDPIRRL